MLGSVQMVYRKRSFDSYFYSTDHEDHFVCLGGYVLVHPALKVSKLTLDGIIADTSTSYLVGDKDIGGIGVGELVEFGLGQFQRQVCVRTVLKEKIGEPKGHAVYDGHPSSHVVETQVGLFLNIRPLWTATFLMSAHPLLELVVPNVSRGDINWMLGET